MNSYPSAGESYDHRQQCSNACQPCRWIITQRHRDVDYAQLCILIRLPTTSAT
jgi:hypothetical protein